MEKISHGDNVLKPRLEWDGEIVPDSEEERIAWVFIGIHLSVANLKDC